MAKIEEEYVTTAIIEAGLPEAKAKKILDLARQLANEIEGKKEKTPKMPAELLVVINDPDGIVPDGLTGWIIQKHPVMLASGPSEWGDLDAELIIQEMCNAHIEEDKSKKKSKGPWCRLGDILEAVKPKWSKTQGVQVRTKIPIAIIGINPDVKYDLSTEDLNAQLGVASTPNYK